MTPEDHQAFLYLANAAGQLNRGLQQLRLQVSKGGQGGVYQEVDELLQKAAGAAQTARHTDPSAVERPMTICPASIDAHWRLFHDDASGEWYVVAPHGIRQFGDYHKQSLASAQLARLQEEYPIQPIGCTCAEPTPGNDR